MLHSWSCTQQHMAQMMTMAAGAACWATNFSVVTYRRHLRCLLRPHL